MEPIRSRRALAEKLGCSHTAVNKAIQSGRIKAEPDGSFNLEKVRKDWNENADFHQQQRGKKEKSAAEESVADPKLKDIQLDREKIKLELDRLKLEVQQGRLLNAEEIRTAWSKMIADAKNKLLSIGDELSQVLADETDPANCRAMVEEKIHAALSHLVAQ